MPHVRDSLTVNNQLDKTAHPRLQSVPSILTGQKKGARRPLGNALSTSSNLLGATTGRCVAVTRTSHLCDYRLRPRHCAACSFPSGRRWLYPIPVCGILRSDAGLGLQLDNRNVPRILENASPVGGLNQLRVVRVVAIGIPRRSDHMQAVGVRNRKDVLKTQDVPFLFNLQAKLSTSTHNARGEQVADEIAVIIDRQGVVDNRRQDRQVRIAVSVTPMPLEA